MTEPYRGIYAIQYSTFRADGYFDESDFESQIEFSIAAGAHGIVWPVMASEFNVLAACGNSVKGVFAAGNMSSSALADVFVEMYERCTGGDHAGAREVQFRLLTYLNLQNIYGHALVREVLRRRGVIQSTHPRFGKSAPMDEHDALELDFAWEQLQPYCRV